MAMRGYGDAQAFRKVGGWMVLKGDKVLYSGRSESKAREVAAKKDGRVYPPLVRVQDVAGATTPDVAGATTPDVAGPDWLAFPAAHGRGFGDE